MPAEANVFRTVEAVGNREILLDAIYDISPEETPFMSNGGRGKEADGIKLEWQTDELDAPDGTNAREEGNEAVIAAITPTVRVFNYCQISDKTFSVSRTQEKVRKAGRRSEAARALKRKIAALRRDQETILTQNQASDSSDPRMLGSILAWIATNVNMDAGGANPTGDGTDVRTDGTQRAFTEALLKDVLSQVWTNGGKADIVMTGAFNKQAASAFTGIAEIRKAVEGARRATIIGAADVYVSDFGNVTFVPNRFSRARDALVLDTDAYSVEYLDDYVVSDLAKTGDTAARKLIVAEYTLKVNNEKAHGLVADLDTA